MKVPELLSKLVSLPSYYPRERAIAAFLTEYVRHLGFAISTVPVSKTRRSILASRGKGQKALLFYGHLDTVGLERLSDWKTDPYSLTVRGKNAFGLGAYDMKGGIAAFCVALEAERGGYTKILLAVDEENISEGAWEAVTKRPDFFSDVSLAVSAEPNFGLGLNGITTGRTGRCVFDVGFEGKGAHIAKYREGVDAIAMLSRFTHTLYEQRDALARKTGSVVQVRAVRGQSNGMSVCASASCEVEALVGLNDSIEGVTRWLTTLTDATIRKKPRKTPYLTSYYFATFPYQRVIAGIIRDRTGKKMVCHTRQSVGDDNVIASLGIPVITWGPDGSNAHSANESVSLTSLAKLSVMFQELIRHHAKNGVIE